jgi:hypothetical protein
MANASDHPQDQATSIDPAADSLDAGYGMTDLEESLRGPDASRVCAAIISRLAALDAQIDARLGSGLRPDQYARAQSIRNCVATAREMMIRISEKRR